MMLQSSRGTWELAKSVPFQEERVSVADAINARLNAAGTVSANAVVDHIYRAALRQRTQFRAHAHRFDVIANSAYSDEAAQVAGAFYEVCGFDCFGSGPIAPLGSTGQFLSLACPRRDRP